MKRPNLNFIVFVLVLFLICFLINRSQKKEKFTGKFVDSFDIFRTEPESEIVEISKEKEVKGWKNFYRNNYLSGEVDYTDSFQGTMIRNYLDNLNFFRN